MGFFSLLRQLIRLGDVTKPSRTRGQAAFLMAAVAWVWAADAGASCDELNRIFWADRQLGVIRSLDLSSPGSPPVNVVENLVDPRGIRIDKVNCKLYWVDQGAGADRIERSNLDGSDREPVVTGLVTPQDLALDQQAGKVYWVDSGGIDRIQRADMNGLNSNVQTVIGVDLYGVRGLELDVAAGLMYWTEAETGPGGGDGVYRATLDGFDKQSIAGGLAFPVGLAIDVAGGKVYWLDSGLDRLQRAGLDGIGGAEDLVTSRMLNPRYVALDLPSGKVYWTDSDKDSLFRANLDGSGMVGIAHSPDAQGLALATPTTRQVVYVDGDATGLNDGSSWADAFTSLQTGLSATAASGPGTQLWVAGGIYKPSAGTDRHSYFWLPPGARVYGGFSGQETTLSQRDWKAHPTILSGDLGVAGTRTDNSFHVVRITSSAASATLDGFTIKDGHANATPGLHDRGAGMMITGGSPTIARVAFLDNRASDLGGGLFNSGSAMLEEVSFLYNQATNDGGGTYNAGTMSIVTADFAGNATSGGDGHDGGAIFNSGTLSIVNGVFRGNSSGYHGGALTNGSLGTLSLTNSTLHDNGALKDGGALFTAGPASILNTIAWGNWANGPPEIAVVGSHKPVVSHSIIQGTGGTGPSWPTYLEDAGGNLDADPLFVNATALDLRLQEESIAVNAGDDASLDLPQTDAGGNPRIAGVAVDIGAFEVQFNCNSIVYVDADAVGLGNGETWEDAFTDLQSALAASRRCDGAQIWVAEGIYVPTQTLDRTQSFDVTGSILIGGFAGTESFQSQRDPSQNLTVLSGDIGLPDVVEDNTYHVVTAHHRLRHASLDGVVVKNGYANGPAASDKRGGGVHVSVDARFSTPLAALYLTNVTVTDNEAEGEGGGLWAAHTAHAQQVINVGVELTNCHVMRNVAERGGGLFLGGTGRIRATTFTDNSAVKGGGLYLGSGDMAQDTLAFTALNVASNSAAALGGGLFVEASESILELQTTRFAGNEAGDAGGGMYFVTPPPSDNEPTHNVIANCVFTGNVSGGIGGAIYGVDLGGTTPSVVVNTTVVGNSADVAAGGIYSETSQVRVENAVVWGNRAPAREQIYGRLSGVVIANSIIEGCGGSGGAWVPSVGVDGGGNIDGDPLFRDGDGADGEAGTLDDDFYLGAESPAVDAGSIALTLAALGELGNVPAPAFGGIAGQDASGRPRWVGREVDMGALERQCPGVLYVDANAVGSNTGGNWEEAFDALSTALAYIEAQDCEASEVWVAAGTYNATCVLDDSTTLLGGFAGTEVLSDQRDWIVNQTILSGEAGVAADPSDNLPHVVVFESPASARIDGFTITGGVANRSSVNDVFAGYGAGILVRGGTAHLDNLLIDGNTASFGGGGVYAGPGEGADSAIVHMNNVSIRSNHVTEGDGGGGVHVAPGAFAIMNRCLVQGNSTSADGGGLQVLGGASISNTAMSGNSTASENGKGGAVFVNGFGSQLALSHVSMSGNASRRGGGLASHTNNQVTVRNSIVAGNVAEDEPEMSFAQGSASPEVTHSLIRGSGGSGPGWNSGFGVDGGGNIDGDPHFSDPDGLDDAWGTADDSLRLTYQSPALDGGDPAYTPVGPDLSGDARVVGPAPDMGAYEFPTVCRLRYYVDASATGLNNGASWSSAYVDLQDALKATSICEPGAEIWVAKGVYRPSPVPALNTRFELKNGVRLYGGFAGAETALEQRRCQDQPSVLSGKTGCGGTCGSTNSVVRAVNPTGVRLDGFTIIGGAGNTGGGLRVSGAGSMTVANVTFDGNHATEGGGVWASDVSLTIENSRFVNNLATNRGMHCATQDVSLVLRNVEAVCTIAAAHSNPAHGLSLRRGESTMSNITAAGGLACSHGLLFWESRGALTNAIVGKLGDGPTLTTSPPYRDSLQIANSLVVGCGSSLSWNPACGEDGGGNIQESPRFRSFSEPTDLRLRPGALAIDGGTSNGLVLPPTDLDGRARVIGSAVDMGAYEFDPEGYFEAQTLVGEDVAVQCGAVSLDFPQVAGGGLTTVHERVDCLDLAEGFSLAGADPPVWYDVSTSAAFTGPVEICISYDPAAVPDESTLQIFHQPASGEGETLPITRRESGRICGMATELSPFAVVQGGATVNVTKAAAPSVTRLLSNIPNPFVARTTVRFDLSVAASVGLTIYDVAGRRIRALARDQAYEAGSHAIAWDGRDDSGAAVGAGVYFYRLRAGAFEAERRMVILR